MLQFGMTAFSINMKSFKDFINEEKNTPKVEKGASVMFGDQKVKIIDADENYVEYEMVLLNTSFHFLLHSIDRDRMDNEKINLYRRIINFLSSCRMSKSTDITASRRFQHTLRQ